MSSVSSSASHLNAEEIKRLLLAPIASGSSLGPPKPFQGDQLTKLENLTDYFSSESFRVGGISGDEGKLTDEEKMWLSKEQLMRFLIATKFDYNATRTRLEKCLAWRRTFGVWNVEETARLVEAESPSGKEFILGYSNKSQPMLHFLPNRSTTDPSERQLKHVVYMLERTCDLMPPGVSNLALIIDFNGKKQAPTSPSMAKSFISILQDFYPERLGVAVLLSIPWIVKKFLDFAFTFVDPVTKQKVAWNIDLVKQGIAPSETTLKEYGGIVSFVYKHEDYWPTLLETCLERRKQHLSNWRELGGRVGLSEWEFKQSNITTRSISQDGTRTDTDVKSGPVEGISASGSSGLQAPSVVVAGETDTGSSYVTPPSSDADIPTHLDRPQLPLSPASFHSALFHPHQDHAYDAQDRSHSISSSSSEVTVHENHGMNEESVSDHQLKSAVPSLGSVVEVRSA